MREAKNLNKKDIKIQDKNRFWRRVEKREGCWAWTGYKDRCGYGIFYFNGVNIPAHRFSYLIHKGNIFKNLLVLHSCDNPECMNPKHLSLGTSKDNVRDMINKNRQNYPCGEKSVNSKLTEKQIREIFKKQTHSSHTELGKEYGVGAQTIGKIINGKRWRHIPRPRGFKKKIHRRKRKLIEEQVREILLKRGKVKIKDLAQEYKVGKTTITNIFYNTTWKHMPRPKK